MERDLVEVIERMKKLGEDCPMCCEELLFLVTSLRAHLAEDEARETALEQARGMLTPMMKDMSTPWACPRCGNKNPLAPDADSKARPLAGMNARDQIRVMKAAFVLLPLADETIDLWCSTFDYLLKTVEAKRG